PRWTTAWFAMRDRVRGARWTISAPTWVDWPAPARATPTKSAEASAPRRSARGTFHDRRDPRLISIHSTEAPAWTEARFVTRLSTSLEKFWRAMYRTCAPGRATTSI